MKQRIFFPVLPALCLAVVFNTLQAATRYVKPTASGAGDGSSWANASADLQAMINASAPGDTVWVAAGTYKPTTGTDRNISFSMKNGVAIYGGFNGTETQLSERNWQTNETILSGDIGTPNLVSDNSYHVINNLNLNNTAIIDGFTIRDGYFKTDEGDAYGAGMNNQNSSPVIRNCIFTLNKVISTALFARGGAMYNHTSNPLIVNCLFQSNVARTEEPEPGCGCTLDGEGGAIYNDNSNPEINNCSFLSNSAETTTSNAFGSGGAIYNKSGSALITNSIFTGNAASATNGGYLGEGGAVYISEGSVNFIHCSLYGNSANSGGAVFTYTSAQISNSIIWGNLAGSNPGIAGFPNVSYSIVQDGYAGTGNLSADPLFVNATAGDLRLQSCSPAINAGSNAAVPSGITTDLDGNPRFYNNGTVDKGAYEFQGNPQPNVPVPPTTTDNALHFDGMNDHVALINSCGTGAPIINGGDAITIEYWFRGSVLQSAVRLQPDGDHYIVSGHYGEHILSNDGGWTPGSGIPVGAAATDGKWHHIAMTWQKATVNGFKSYLDGQLVGQRNSSAFPLPVVSAGAYLGALNGNDQLMNGSLDNVRIWNVALTKEQIQAGLCGLTLPQSGLVAWYAFDHGDANGNNTNVLPGVENMAQPGYYNGQLNNFGWNGPSSNWIAGPAKNASRLYVNADLEGAGNLDGFSWQTAFSDLQDALNYPCTSPNLEIWVAAGTYKPTSGSDRTVSFRMKNGVAIYGGFNGTETELSQRDWVTNITTLSGDLNGDDIVSGSGVSLNITNNGENSYHVVYNNFTGDNPLTSAAILDGFTIRGGRTEISLIGPNSVGGGMQNTYASPTLSNLIFIGNMAERGGGGLFNSLASSPVLTNVIFQQNLSFNEGGGMYNFTNANIVLNNVAFINNLSYGVFGGGGMANFNNSPTYNNCRFSGNFATYAGAVSNVGVNSTFTNCTFTNNAVFQDVGCLFAENSTLNFLNCFFSGNRANLYSGVMYVRSATVNATNCVFWDNAAGSVHPYNQSGVMSIDGTNPLVTINNSILWANQSHFFGVQPTITYSIVQGGYSGTGNLSDDPLFANEAGGDFQLKACSPAIDAGNNASVPLDLTTDLAGNPRFYNSGTVDMGTYEFQGNYTPPPAPPAFTANNALHFDGTDDYVEIYNCAATPIVNGTNAITIEYWFKGTSNQSAVRLQPGDDFIVAGWNGMHILSNDGGASGIPVGAAANDGNWHHVAMTWKRNSINGFKSYLDGQLVAARNSSNNPLPVITSHMYLGGWGTSEPMSGTLDEVRIWSVERSQSEILAAMCGVNLPQTGLQIYYKFDHGTATGSNEAIVTLANSANAASFTGVLNNFNLMGSGSNWVSSLEENQTEFLGFTWYLDADGDGYYTGTGVMQCTSPGAGFVTSGLIGGGDCNDADINIHPGATEFCNGIDDNCNGQPDEGNACTDNIIYVNLHATGANDGSSWVNAYTDLQIAIADPRPNIYQIWVAQGTYKPTTGNDRNKSFSLRGNWAIYGGFNGTETQLAQRDWRLHETILSGDIGDPGNTTDNSFHVVYTYVDPFSTNNLANAVLDGFTITGANATGGNTNGGGIYLGTSNLYPQVNPSIRNCTIINNSASNIGGGICTENSVNAYIENCIFKGNSAGIGGAVRNGSNTTLVNCLFSGNTAVYGGGIHNDHQLTVKNCSFSGNSGNFGGAISQGGSSFTLTGCILWGNNTEIYLWFGPAPVVSYSIVQGGYAGTGNFNANPLFVNQPPIGLGTTGDLHLTAGSPAIDAGTASGAPATDLDGNPRPAGAGYDMGAYEFTGPSCPTVTFTATPINTCAGSDNGQIAISGETGGNGPYLYSINNGTNYQSGATFTGLTANTYPVKIKDVNNCESAAQNVLVGTFTGPNAGTITGTTSVCVGSTTNLSSNGAPGGAWSSDANSTATVGSNTGVVSGVAPGMAPITYTVTDGNGCVSSTSAVVTVTACNNMALSGTIKWEHDGTSGVQNATVNLTGTATGNDQSGIDGYYEISIPSTTGNFTLTPTKNINKLNGVTSADATAIQQHVANSTLLPAPFKRIAADVNKSNTITTMDATLINQALLGNQSALNQITSWRFVPAAYNFPNPNLPWGFPEQITLTGVSGSVSGQDFKGVKLGDVVSTWANPASFGKGEPMVLNVQDQVLQAGSELTAEFRADQLDDLTSFQFALQFDPEQLELVEIEPAGGGLSLTMNNFGTYNLAEGEIRVVWAQAAPVLFSEAAPVFRLRFRALESGTRLSEALRLDEEALPGHCYNSAYAESGVELRYSSPTGTEPGLGGPPLTLENQPNPFVEVTTLRFVLPEAGVAELRVTDAAGRLLFSQKKPYAAGLQQEMLRLEGAGGVLFAELVTAQGSVVRKMLALR